MYHFASTSREDPCAKRYQMPLTYQEGCFLSQGHHRVIDKYRE